LEKWNDAIRSNSSETGTIIGDGPC